MNAKQLKACRPIDWLDVQGSTSFIAELMAKGELEGGKYLLKNGQVSEVTVYGQEAGVFINKDLYIPLAKQPKQLLTAKEAETYARIEGLEIPTIADLMLLSWSNAKVNCALQRIGCDWLCTEAPLFANLWYKGTVAEHMEDNEKRKLLFIQKAETATVHNYNFILNKEGKMEGIVADNRQVYLWKNQMFLPADLHVVAAMSESCILRSDAFWFRYAKGRLTFVGLRNGSSPLCMCRDEYVISIFSDHDFELWGDCAEQFILRKGTEWYLLEKSDGTLISIGNALIHEFADVFTDAEEDNWANRSIYQIVVGGLNCICSIHRNDELSCTADGFSILSENYLGEQGYGLAPEFTRSFYKRNSEGLIEFSESEII